MMSKCYAQFIEQPAAGTIFVPVNTRANLSCSVDDPFRIDWQVGFRNEEPVLAASEINDALFARRNFTFTGLATTTSTLSFEVLRDGANNETNITCIAQQGISTSELGYPVQVIFYESPPPPAGLSVAENDKGLLNVSWSLGFIEGVPVNYTLIVLNLNTTSAQPIIIAELLDQYYVIETSRPCDVYSFTVTAVTAAGNSTPSQELIFMKSNSSDKCIITTNPMSPIDATTLDVQQAILLSSGSLAGIVIAVIAVLGIIAVVIITAIMVLKNRKGSETNVLTQGQNNKSEEAFAMQPKNLKENSDNHKQQVLEEAQESPKSQVQGHPDVTADFSSLDAAQHHHKTEVHLTIRSNSNPDIQYFLHLRNSSTAEEVLMHSQDKYIAVTPQERGRHVLGIKANGQHIKDSPYHFEVEIPLNTFDLGIEKAYGLTAFEDKVFLSVTEGIKVFKNQKKEPFKFFTLKNEEELGGITVHQKTGDIFVATGKTGEVIKLNSEGEKINKVKLKGDSNMIYSNGLNVNSKDELYVSDNLTHTIQVFDLNLKYKRILTGKKKNCKRFQSPRAVVVGKDGKVYIAEQTRIQVLSPDEKFIRIIGEGKICDARGLKILDDEIYVAHEGCASLFTTDGKHVRDFFKYDENVSWVDITVDSDGYVYISMKNKLHIL